MTGAKGNGNDKPIWSFLSLAENSDCSHTRYSFFYSLHLVFCYLLCLYSFFPKFLLSWLTFSSGLFPNPPAVGFRFAHELREELIRLQKLESRVNECLLHEVVQAPGCLSKLLPAFCRTMVFKLEIV